MSVNIELWIGIGAVLVPAVLWGIRRYLKVMVDGKITLEEGLESIVEGVEVIETAIDGVEEVLENDE